MDKKNVLGKKACFLCPKSFSQNTHLFFHVWLHHYIDVFHPERDISQISADDLVRCDICPTYTTVYEKDVHMLWSHNTNNPKPYKIPCNKCGQTFGLFQTYIKHLISHETGIPETNINRIVTPFSLLDYERKKLKRQKKNEKRNEKRRAKALQMQQENLDQLAASISEFTYRQDGSMVANIPFGYNGPKGAVSNFPRPSILGPPPTLQVPVSQYPLPPPPLPNTPNSRSELANHDQPIENNIEIIPPPPPLPPPELLRPIPLPPLPTAAELFGTSQRTGSKDSQKNKKNNGSGDVPVFGKSLSLLENKAKETAFQNQYLAIVENEWKK